MKQKNCITCGKIFNQFSWNQKTCSVDCYKPIKSEQDKKYREKKGDELLEKKKSYYNNGPKIKKCPMCGTEHKKRLNNFCSQKCYLKKMGSMRIGTKNPNWKAGSHSQTYNKRYADHIYKTKGMTLEELGCEICGANATVTLDRHHIIFKSEAGWHEEVNNPRNIVQCCRSCHLKFHSKSIDRGGLIQERKLDELFPEIRLQSKKTA